MRQAVIIIHGVGEQRPMDTLRNFVKNIVGEKIYNKPDKMSSLFELRRLQTPNTSHTPLTDFYEYYWAHHMRDTKIRVIISWFRSLLFRKPGNISSNLKLFYYTAWFLIFVSLLLMYHAIHDLFSEKSQNSLILFSLVPIFWIIDYNVLRWSYGIIDDAARYLNPHPDNIEQRNKIRKEGLNLIETLHHSKKYNRIIIVGHSLGSVIAYDLIRIYWSTLKFPDNPRHTKQQTLENFSHLSSAIFNNGALSANSKINKFQQLQLKLWTELRACDWPCLITDFVTIGSPLAHADMLLTSNKEEFKQRVSEGEYPVNPPLDSHEISYRKNITTDIGLRSFLTPTHLAPFICIQWINIYFPHKMIKGDLIGGPLQEKLGKGIFDIPVGLSGIINNSFASHVKYWVYPDGQKEIKEIKHPTKAIKSAMKLDSNRGAIKWPSP